MTDTPLRKLRFSINNWSHLYSLEQAILRTEQLGANRLHIEGKIRNEALFARQDTDIHITFHQVADTPAYSRNHQGRLILGELGYADNTLSCSLPVDARVFEELRKNLLEYAGVDGIHIMVNLGILLDAPTWPEHATAPIVTLDYAMRGDA